jgi:sec-independent protein translocase protein TatC
VTDLAEPDDGRMTLVEHLTELRRRIVISIVAVAVGAIVAFILYNQILELLSQPYRDLTVKQCPPNGCDLINTDPLSPFAVRLKLATYGGIILALPVWIWQLWRFVTPGLHKNEKRYAIPFVLSSVVLFSLGAAIAFLTLPKALEFLVQVGGSEVSPSYTVDKYISLVSLMMLAFGLSFEFPLLLIFLMAVGILQPRTLSSNRRWAAVGIVTFAAIITPSQDPYSLLFMAGPMYLFFELSILIGRFIKR